MDRYFSNTPPAAPSTMSAGFSEKGLSINYVYSPIIISSIVSTTLIWLIARFWFRSPEFISKSGWYYWGIFLIVSSTRFITYFIMKLITKRLGPFYAHL